MKDFFKAFLFLFLLSACTQKELPVILWSGSDSRIELAAKEVRRYMYLRTGELLPIQIYSGQALPSKAILVTDKTETAINNLLSPDLQSRIYTLSPESYVLSNSGVIPAKAGTVPHPPSSGQSYFIIMGGSPQGTLYGAYAFAEKLGVRFYLHGDVVPDGHIRPHLPEVDETGSPLFETRGILPFHDFPEGPDWWSLQDYKAYLSQMAKMKMNFIGLHTYPEGGVGPEPLVWIGTPDQINDDGTVKSAYPAHHFVTTTSDFGFTGTLTKDYSNGLGNLFEDDSYGTDYMIGIHEWPDGKQAEIDLFNKSGRFFGEAFRYAHEEGIKTCVGTETPLTVPKAVKERDPSASTFDYYTGMFKWINRNYPLDYYWFWTPEDWTWSGNTEENIKKTVDDLLAAQRADDKLGDPFQLATCGWVLGPVQDRSMFDRFLPKSWPMSCINQQVGFTPVDPGFARVHDRPLWAIPWMEDDPALTIMQLWAGRMRADAADALAYGCNGLIGIHWRTKTLQTTVSALAQAGWRIVTGFAVTGDTVTREPVTGNRSLVTSSEADSNFLRRSRDLPIDDFYADWAKAQFGGQVADSMGKLMASLDGQEVSINAGGGKKTRLPRQGDWTGPGGVIVDTLPWEQRKQDYAFVDRMASWAKYVQGPGNRERFDYWLNFFRYHRAFGQFACALGQTEKLLKKVDKPGAGQAGSYLDEFVTLRIQLIDVINEALGYLLAYASTPGDLGTIANWEQHLLPYNVDGQAKRIERATGMKLPPEALPSHESLKIKKVLVPTVRSVVRKGESLPVKLVLYGIEPGKAVLRFRPIGKYEYQEIPFTHVDRGVYKAEIPAGSIPDDFEYSLLIRDKNQNEYLWPATAPEVWQTVVVVKGGH